MKRSSRYRRLVNGGRRGSPALLDLAKEVSVDVDHIFFRRASAVTHGGDPTLGEEPLPAALSPSLEGINIVLPLAAGSFALLIAALASSYPEPPDPDLVRVGHVGSAIARSVSAAGSHLE